MLVPKRQAFCFILIYTQTFKNMEPAPQFYMSYKITVRYFFLDIRTSITFISDYKECIVLNKFCF